LAGKIQHTPLFTVGMMQLSSPLKAHSPPFAVQAASSLEVQVSVVSAPLAHSPELIGLLFCPLECNKHAS